MIQKSVVKLFVFVFIILGSFNSLEAQKAITLTDDREEYHLGQYLDILEDPSGQLSIKDVTSPKYSHLFTASQRKVPNFGFIKSAIWVRFKITNEANIRSPWVLELRYPNMHYVDLYRLSSAGEIYEIKKTGNLRPFETRDHKYHNLVFFMMFSKQESQTIYLRFQNEESMTIPLTLWSITAFMRQSQFNYIMVGAFIGILLIMIGFHVFLLFSLRDKSYFYYILAITALLMFSLSSTGIAFLYLWPNLMGWNHLSLPIFAGLMVLSLIKFSDVFLLVKKQMPVLHQIINIWMLVMGLLVFLTPFTSYRFVIIPMVIVGMLGGVLLLFTGISSFLKGFQPARYFLLSMAVLALSGIIHLLVRLGIMPSKHIFEQGFSLGNIFFVLLMSLALADRIKLLRREKEKAIQELKESEERFRALVETTNDFIWEVDRNGAYTYASPTIVDLLGYETGEVLGKKLIDFMPADEAKRFMAMFEKKSAKSEPFIDLENEIMRKDGGIVILETHGVPFFDKKGNLLGYRGIDRDITQRKRLEEEGRRLQTQIQHAQKLESLGVLAGGIAHDLNNILTAIIGNTELTLRGFKKGKYDRDNLDQVILSGRKASELVSKILAFSRKQIINPEVIDVNDTIQNFSKILNRVISEDIDITMNLCDNLPPIKADPMQIEQILINLAVNAQDAIMQKKKTGTDKVITVETAEVYLEKEYISNHVGSTVGQHILISVTDTGIGMGKEIIDRVFEPFFTTKDLGKGTGLGLSTVYGIVKQNNGSIYIYSEPGEGTTVKIYWPASKDKTQLNERIEDGEINQGSETILFVEDDEKIRKSTEQLLVLFGYKVFSAVNGKQALDLVKDKNIKIDILITDVVMPEMGGIELSEKLKKTYSGLEVLYCSGYPDNHIVSTNGILKQDINFLGKPYSGRELAKKIREILDKK